MKIDLDKVEKQKKYYSDLFYDSFFGTEEQINEVIERISCKDLNIDYLEYQNEYNKKKLGLIPDEKKTIEDLTETQKRIKRKLILERLNKLGIKIDKKTGKRI